MAHSDVHLIKAAILKAIAHPLRLRILECLCRKEQPVGRLAQMLAVDQATLSRHLSALKQGGLVAARHQGAYVIYQLKDNKIVGLLDQLTNFLRRKLSTDQELVRNVK